ncbi:S9 family peptidase [Xylophilus sp. Leaf220]|uniref:alpha/beta hydrolase family protein n=1 Tax=Xylophilus sp. Leaf220 TaxID=1735686 RepID=UPI00191BF927|nr:prolyl oligopeptidase family serine peptidase [Xylophilus sp. Leaf220]
MSLFLSAVSLALAAGAHARVHEEAFDLPVQVTHSSGKRFSQPIRVTVWTDDANPKPSPVLVLNHGRAPDAEGRQKLGRARYGDAARFFLRHGFIVAVPTRIGYGVSGGEDLENSGPCQRKSYAPGFAAAADQVAATLEAIRQRPDAAQDRAVIAGQSFGGATTLAAAGRNLPGVVAAIDFAGGAGGNPKLQPGRPCSPHLLESTLGSYGKTARVPVLWLYAQNDQYFGPTHPREWFDAFRAAGGTGEFIEFPPQGEDGHQTFARFPQTWHPPVAAFLERQGFPALRPDPVAPETVPAAGAPPLPAHVPTTRDEASHD